MTLDDDIRRLRAEGWTFARIAGALGCSQHRISTVLDPGYRERRRLVARQRSQTLRTKGAHPHHAMSAQDKADAERLLAMVPADTRPPMARMLGDPLPGRSALDRMREAGR